MGAVDRQVGFYKHQATRGSTRRNNTVEKQQMAGVMMIIMEDEHHNTYINHRQVEDHQEQEDGQRIGFGIGGTTWSSSSSRESSFSSLDGDDDDDEDTNSIGSNSSINSNGSVLSSSSNDELVDDDAISPASSSPSSPLSHGLQSRHLGALNDLSALMTHLPIKRGLSKFYMGKSQSFTSLDGVESLEDLAKKGNPCNNRKLKYCKSYAGGLNSLYKPKPSISKRMTSKSSSSLSCLLNNSKKGSSFNLSNLSNRPPVSPTV